MRLKDKDKLNREPVFLPMFLWYNFINLSTHINQFQEDEFKLVNVSHKLETIHSFFVFDFISDLLVKHYS